MVSRCITPISASVVSGLLPWVLPGPLRLNIPLLSLIKTPVVGFRAHSNLVESNFTNHICKIPFPNKVTHSMVQVDMNWVGGVIQGVLGRGATI